jgi:3-phosphoshikimate 1-carboxyvinyltransferase
MPTLLVHPQTTPLQATLTVPGDKSISHRAVMFAAIAEGSSRIDGWLPAGDTLATLAAIQALGIGVTVRPHSATNWSLEVAGRGLHGLVPPEQGGVIDCRNAGTAIRLLAGILAGQRFPVVLDGSGQLRKRPMRRVADPLTRMGANISTTEGRPPLTLRPAPLRGITHTLAVASAQVKSALLLAGLYADGRTTVCEPGPARDHTERMLAAMGATIQTENGCITLTPPDRLQAVDWHVPADISSAAFPLVAAALVPGSRLTINRVGVNPTRTGILDILADLGVQVSGHNLHETGGEPVADLTVTAGPLQSAEISGPVVVRAIDEFPILAVALSQAAGTSQVHDAAELRVKEVDRISVLAGELRKMGIVMQEQPDGFRIHGTQRLHGATLDSHDDHRLGMCLAVAALLADGPSRILDAGCIADSFPGFVETMQAAGAAMQWAD